MAVNGYYTNKYGAKYRLLNPAQRGKKFAHELKINAKVTTMNQPKNVNKKTGVARGLKDTERAYRSGYLQARSDNAKAYNHNKNKKNNKSNALAITDFFVR